MTTEYRQNGITEATEKYNQARSEFFAAKTRKARLAADEAMNFWGNKLAFLESAR